jgi:hypothetical protein
MFHMQGAPERTLKARARKRRKERKRMFRPAIEALRAAIARGVPRDRAIAEAYASGLTLLGEVDEDGTGTNYAAVIVLAFQFVTEPSRGHIIESVVIWNGARMRCLGSEVLRAADTETIYFRIRRERSIGRADCSLWRRIRNCTPRFQRAAPSRRRDCAGCCGRTAFWHSKIKVSRIRRFTAPRGDRYVTYCAKSHRTCRRGRLREEHHIVLARERARVHSRQL